MRLNYIIILFVLILSSCADLDETMRSSISADAHFTTADGFQDLTLAMYDPLYEHYGYEAGEIMTIPGTDEFTYGQGRRALWNDYTPALNPSYSDPRGMLGIWNEFYRGINLTNAVIERVDEVEGISEGQKTSWTAEAKFLRAFYYHILVQQFGDVHLTLEETEGVQTEASRTPADEVWDVVIDDFEFAIANLPEVQGQYGRATANAARHALSKVHLVLENWNEAANLAKEVIDSGYQSLLDDYADLWDPSNRRHSEVIWALVRTSDTGPRRDVRTSRDFSPRVRNISGVDSKDEFGSGTFRYKATRFLIEDVFGNDPNNDGVNIFNDTRYFAGFKEVWHYNDASNLPEGVALGDTAAYFPVAAHYQELTDEEIAEKPYMFLRIKDWDDTFASSPVKKFRNAGERMYWGRDVQIMRLAETYLIAAEALMMMGNLSEAVEYFNVVRLRAQAPGETIPLITESELDIDEILDERARELYGETMRWLDLKRTGKLLERVRAHNKRAAPNIQEFHLLRPIPQSQIDRTTSDFPQNPGY
ncbi:MAG: RagB/SusD family nutrient uptake outer membrane protein [Balneolaceae bacterium]|nr:MAG: RagB/SusD family nutrient uptake outer membrane protein [Balneolaceae bacterium]